MSENKTEVVDILVLPPQDKPVFFIVNGINPVVRNGVDALDIVKSEAGKAYWYDEHTCPTNWIKNTVAISIDGNHDPHGLFKYLRDVPREKYAELQHRLDNGGGFPLNVLIEELCLPVVTRKENEEIPLFSYNSAIGSSHCDYIAQYTDVVVVWENDNIVDPSTCKDVYLGGNIRVMKDGFAIASGCPIAVYDSDDNDVFPTVDFSSIKRIVVDDTFFGEKHITIESGITLLFKYS